MSIISKKSALDKIKKIFETHKQVQYSGWRVAGILVVGGMLLSGLATGIFIYRYIYATISNATAIVIIESSLNIDAIDLAAFEKAKQYYELKNTSPIWSSKIRYPFEYEQITNNQQTNQNQ